MLKLEVEEVQKIGWTELWAQDYCCLWELDALDDIFHSHKMRLFAKPRGHNVISKFREVGWILNKFACYFFVCMCKLLKLSSQEVLTWTHYLIREVSWLLLMLCPETQVDKLFVGSLSWFLSLPFFVFLRVKCGFSSALYIFTAFYILNDEYFSRWKNSQLCIVASYRQLKCKL